MKGTRGWIQRKSWCMGPYAVVDYNFTFWRRRSLLHIYHGQPYAIVDFIPQSGTWDSSSGVFFVLDLGQPPLHPARDHMRTWTCWKKAKSKVRYWVIKSTLWYRAKVDSGKGLSIVDVLESTLEWTYGEVIVNSSIGSHIPCFSLHTVSESRKTERERREEALAAFFSWRGRGRGKPNEDSKKLGATSLYSFLRVGHKNKVGILPFNFSMVSTLERIDRQKAMPNVVWPCKGTLWQVFICLRTPPFLGFCLGW